MSRPTPPPHLRTLIDAPTLLALQRSGTPVVLLDCSHDLFDADAGARDYAAGHLPGAHHLHLERDLAGPKAAEGPRRGGRHPLPARAAWAATAASLGIAPGVPVVAYDGQGGPYAARAWWLLRWLGHDAVAVLDGGPEAWVAAGGLLESGPPPARVSAAPYPAGSTAMPVIAADALLARLGAVCIVDARSDERFRGEAEPLDAVAGHIPGALNRFFRLNLDERGRFKDAATLRAEWQALLGGRNAAEVVQQCGSGVTACHNLLALEHAGLGTSALYPGSWSEWSADPGRPVARG
jgi:thiosulfate/3-mercaptopyruvate sulfurtransferase